MISRPPLNRRTLNLFALSSLVTACGGGDTPSPPEITAQPQDVTVQEGQPLSFTVTLKDEAQASYQWARNGTAITGATQKTFAIALAALTDTDAQFSVTISNPAGSVQSRQARLTVQVATHSLGEVVATGWGALPITNRIALSQDGSIYGVNYNPTALHRCRPDGTMIPLAGTLQSLPATAPSLPLFSVLEDPVSGSLYVAEAYTENNFTFYFGKGGRIIRIDANGDITKLFESTALTPSGLARDAAGNLYTVDIGHTTLHRLAPTGEISTIAMLLSSTTNPNNINVNTWLTASPEGFVYACAKSNNTSSIPDTPGILRFSPSGVIDRLYLGVRGIESDFAYGLGWYAGNLYALYRSTGEDLFSAGFIIRQLRASGEIATVAGTVGETTQNELGRPGKLKASIWQSINTAGRILLRTTQPVDGNIAVILP